MENRNSMVGKGGNIGKWSAEKISRVVLLSIVGVSAVVFLLFYLVGYNMPSMWNESINSPLFTDLVIVLMIALLISAFAIALFSKFVSTRKNHTPAIVNGIKGKKVTRLVVLFVAVIMLLSYLPSPDDVVMVDGKVYENDVMLRMTNMFVFTSLLLMAVGVCIICLASFVNRRIR